MNGVRTARRLVLAGLTVLGFGLIGAGCDVRRPGALEDVRARGELRVATLNGPTTYFEGVDGPEGLEYELAERFAQQLGVRLVMVPMSDRAALRRAVDEKRVDLAAAQLTWTTRWRGSALPSVAYSDSPLFWVYERSRPRPRAPEDLTRLRAVILDDSAPANYLESLSIRRRAAFNVVVLPRELGRNPLELVEAGRADVTLVDGREFALTRDRHPSLAVAFPLTDRRPLYWMVRRDGRDLLEVANVFLQGERARQAIPTLEVASLTAPRRLPMANAEQLAIDIEIRLPALRPIFEQAALESGFDWRLLAALAYQESQWIAEARSPNGAQGLMMLMPRTARELGVANPFDPTTNILAGARYLALLHAKLPDRIPDPDRTWMAIAAYNMGHGHLEDVRVLTARQGGNADRWLDVRERLELMSEEFWYLQTQNGYARGWETKLLADRVQQYLGLLETQLAAAADAQPVVVGRSVAERQEPAR